tara:strand:- start:2802 stop:4139 length:1338 start_codon:yes stop_codon:yes gene_type:complete
MNSSNQLVKSFQVFLGKARQLLEKSEFDESLNNFHKAEKLLNENGLTEAIKKDDKVLLYRGLAFAHHNKNNVDQAISYSKKVLSLEQNDLITLSNLAIFYRAKNKFNKSIDVLKQLLGVKPDAWEAYYNMSRSYIGLGELEKAKNCLFKANEMAPNNKTILNDIAALTDDFDEKYEKLLKLKDELLKDDNNIFEDGTFSDNLIDVFTNLGTVNLIKGNTRQGLQDLGKGPGFFEFDITKETKSDDIKEESQVITSNENPNFISSWKMENIQLCDDIIEMFEKNSDKHVPGMMSRVGINKERKVTVEIPVRPIDIQRNKNKLLLDYFEHIGNCINDYCNNWNVLKHFKKFHIGVFNIQKYELGGHFSFPHMERDSMNTQHRYFAFMTYLNDVDEGGETIFPYYDITIKPKKGTTLIWPSDWTHTHYGDVVKSNEKYIVTGWIEYHK